MVCRRMRIYNFNLIFRAAALKMMPVRLSETMASTGHSTRRQNPKEHQKHGHSYENLKFHMKNVNSKSIQALIS